MILSDITSRKIANSNLLALASSVPQIGNLSKKVGGNLIKQNSFVNRPREVEGPSFGEIRRLLDLGPNPFEAIKNNPNPTVSELLHVQRAFGEYALKVELCAKTGDAVSGIVRKLQQGG